MQMLSRIGYAVVLWMIPYVTAIPLLPLMQSDPTLFKTIMIVEGSIVGAVLAVLYLAFCLCMILLENRFPLFGIMH